MDPDEMEPRKVAPQWRDLEPLSVEELEAHITALEAEIVRARRAIGAKKSLRSGAEQLFRK
jgi:uncharacterized small protein (DUF1192 family)